MSEQIQIIDSHAKAIVTKFIPPTSFNGARVAASDSDGNRVVIGWSDSLSHSKAALALCEKMGWEGTLVQGWTKTGCVFSFLPKGAK